MPIQNGGAYWARRPGLHFRLRKLPRLATERRVRCTITKNAAPRPSRPCADQHPTSSSQRRGNSQRDFLPRCLPYQAGVEVGDLSIRGLGELCGETRYCDAEDNLATFFKSLKRYCRLGDFQGLATLPRPRPLQLPPRRLLGY